MPRYVLLTHDHPEWHWDFMLESADGLMTWRLAQNPQEVPGQPAVPLPLHRLDYLRYEGPVSGGRGHVQRVDEGEFDWLEQQPHRLKIALRGRELRGIVEIIMDAPADCRWLWQRDAPAG